MAERRVPREPAPDGWSVRVAADGTARVDGYEQPDVQPAPVTTIAWRLQHMAVDGLDSYSARAFDATGADAHGDE